MEKERVTKTPTTTTPGRAADILHDEVAIKDGVVYVNVKPKARTIAGIRQSIQHMAQFWKTCAQQYEADIRLKLDNAGRTIYVQAKDPDAGYQHEIADYFAKAAGRHATKRVVWNFHNCGVWYDFGEAQESSLPAAPVTGSSEQDALETKLATEIEKSNKFLTEFKDAVDRDTVEFSASSAKALAEVREALARVRGYERSSS